jgi:hypothetical protein
MKKALTILVALALGMTAFAQPGPGRPGGGYNRGPAYGGGHRSGYRMDYFTGSALEFGITLNSFTNRERYGQLPYRPDRVGLFGEYRVDLGPYVDMGLQLSTTFGKGSLTYDSVNRYGDDMWYWQGAPLLVTDVNMLPYSGFNPYFGIGLGPGFGYEKNQMTGHSEWSQALVLSPRAGIELFERLRLSVQYQWYLNDGYKYSHISFGLSWAFQPWIGGGRPMHR